MKAGMSSGGVQRLMAQYTRRANFLGNEGIRTHLQFAAKKIEQQMKLNIQSFTPGPVPDLSAAYKKRKTAQVGYAYPILWRTGAWLSSMYSRVVKEGRRWVVKIGFAGRHPEGPLNESIAQWHFTGEGNNPKRDPTKMPPELADVLHADLQKRLAREAKRGR